MEIHSNTKGSIMKITQIKGWVSKEIREKGICCKVAIGATACIDGSENPNIAIRLLNMRLREHVKDALSSTQKPVILLNRNGE